jgi:hypothetical protein
VKRLIMVLLAALVLCTGCHARPPAPPLVHKAQGAATTPLGPTAPTAAATPIPLGAYEHPAGKYLGVSLPAAAPGLGAYAAATGTTPDILEVFQNFGTPFDTADAAAAWRAHALLLDSWQPVDTTLTAIAQGRDDLYIRAFAKQIAATGIPVALDFGHEFNGPWMSWGAGGAQNATGAQFVAAWRHIHDLFAAAGAHEVIWVWAPNVVNPVPAVDLADWWPGAGYVDWVGISGYWTGSTLGADDWSSLFGPTEEKVAALTADPVVITETGAEQGPQKAGWVTAMLAGLGADPRVIGMVYFDYGTAQGKRADWTLQDDPAALAAYRAGAAKLHTAQPS